MLIRLVLTSFNSFVTLVVLSPLFPKEKKEALPICLLQTFKERVPAPVGLTVCRASPAVFSIPSSEAFPSVVPFGVAKVSRVFDLTSKRRKKFRLFFVTRFSNSPLPIEAGCKGKNLYSFFPTPKQTFFSFRSRRASSIRECKGKESLSSLSRLFSTF